MVNMNDGYHGWVSVKDALPPEKKGIWLATTSSGELAVFHGMLDRPTLDAWWVFDFGYWKEPITHWQHYVRPTHPDRKVLRNK